ncbi:MAG: NAD(P)/FAD-dependent oxidoreductase [Planctomycetaceae bacterium]|nr:NAD(P)/FAD-dependent oxidoreductase [Planctomycetaceae bacterium]
MVLDPGPQAKSQPRMTGSVQPQYDCIVMGAGPGGGTVASLVAQQGWKTLLVDRDPMPRFHVGESLMPETYWTFERLGVLEDFRRIAFTRKYGVQFVSGDGKESRAFVFSEHEPRASAMTWHVERAELDCLLFDTAAKHGADCRDLTRIIDFQLNPNGDGKHSVNVQLPDGSRHHVWTKVLVDASGQQALIANRLGLVNVDPKLKKAAIWGYFSDAARNPVIEPEVTCILHTEDKLAWFWYIPLSDGRVSVGAVGDNDYLLKSGMSPEDRFEWLRRRCPGVLKRLESATLTTPLRVAKEFSYTTSRRAGDGWVLVGDAYGFIDPVYSSGVYLALKSGEWAADAIVEGLRTNDLSAQQLGRWTPQFDQGVHWIRKLVHAFYCNEFSFGAFMKEYPQYGPNLTDLLIGKVFEGEPGRIFDDLDPWMEKSIALGRDCSLTDPMAPRDENVPDAFLC